MSERSIASRKTTAAVRRVAGLADTQADDQHLAEIAVAVAQVADRRQVDREWLAARLRDAPPMDDETAARVEALLAGGART